MLRTLLAGLAILSATTFLGADEEKPSNKPRQIATQEEFDKLVKPMVAAILACEQVVLHEGLPHQDLEPGLFQKELRFKKTTERGGYPFYVEPIKLQEADAAKLQSFCANAASFQKLTGKFCRFHPDWCLEFKGGDKKYEVQICLSCQEATLSGPDGSVRVDLSEKGYESFAASLPPLRKNRPATKE